MFTFRSFLANLFIYSMGQETLYFIALTAFLIRLSKFHRLMPPHINKADQIWSQCKYFVVV